MSYGFRNTHIQLIVYALSQFPGIEQVILYGPRTKRGCGTSHNVDFALIGKQLDFNVQQELLQRLSRLALPYVFDLVIYEQLSRYDLIDHIDKTGVKFYSKKSAVLV